MRPETRAAIDAVRGALALLRDRRGAEEIREKEALDYATGTDTAIEQQLIARLTDACPDIGVLAEESGRRGSRERFWVIDPICGTTNFAAALPFVNVNVALVEGGRVMAGVLLDGNAGQVYWAERAGGAWREGEPIHASDRGRIIHIDFGHRTATGEVGVMAGAMRRILAEHRFHVRVLGSSVVLAYLACGRLAGHIVDTVHPWDTNAGALLAEEAGAIITDFQGRPWQHESAQLVCGANAAVHAELLELITSSE